VQRLAATRESANGPASNPREHQCLPVPGTGLKATDAPTAHHSERRHSPPYNL